MKSKPSKGEQMGYDQSTANQGKVDEQTGQVNQNLNQFNGPVQSSPYYKSLLQAGTTSTNQSYDNAARNLKMSMQGAGVSGASGAVAGNGAALGNARAGALGQVGTGAVQGATDLQMQANQQRLGEAGMFSGAGTSYYSGANQAEIERLKNQGSIFNSLLQAGTGVASAYMGMPRKGA